jgi:hypothetical protein
MQQKQMMLTGLAVVTLVSAAGVSQRLFGQTAAVQRSTLGAPAPVTPKSAMNNPYRMLENWPHLGTIKPGAAIGIIPDGKGGVWLQHRSVPGILHIDASGDIVKKFDVTFSQAHGFCQDRDGNFWAADSGPFNDAPDAGVKGNQVFKYDQNGKLLLTIGKAGVSKAGTDTFIQPTACTITPTGDILIADGHWPRPTKAQQDGDRLVWFTKDGKFIKAFGKLGTGPGEFMGPHALAFDSQGRLFVADRSNNRVQIFDKDMTFVDDWKQFGRPSGIWILKDDTLIVSDSESSYAGFVPAEWRAKNPDATTARNAGWQTGIRIGSAKDGSLRYFISDTRPEGLAGDELGNVFGGLTSGCDTSRSGGCLQKYVRK